MGQLSTSVINNPPLVDVFETKVNFSAREQRAASYYSATVYFRDGGRCVFHSFDLCVPFDQFLYHPEYHYEGIHPWSNGNGPTHDRHRGFQKLWKMIKYKFMGRYMTAIIYDNKTDKAVAKFVRDQLIFSHIESITNSEK